MRISGLYVTSWAFLSRGTLLRNKRWLFQYKTQSLREKLVALKGSKKLLDSYEKLSPQLGSKIFLTGAQKLRGNGKGMERQRFSVLETASLF